MAPRIVIIGGGSYQWVPKLLIDVANTPSLHEAEIVLEDVDPAPLPLMSAWIERISELRNIGLTVTSTTNQREALEGADYVVVSISTGGFTSMRHDLEIPERYGIKQSVGDSVGPGGIIRAQRNIPVLVGIARDMVEICPDAWLLNLTNPMTALCRAVTKETPIKTIGLCHELTMTRFTLSMLLDADFVAMNMEVTGVNHLPVITSLDIAGRDGFELLRELRDDPARATEPLAFDLPDDFGVPQSGGHWTRGDLLANNRLKLELLDRFGVLPAAGDRHLAEFFPGFLTEASDWGKRWGVALTTIEDREKDQGSYVATLEALIAGSEVSTMPSGELVAPLLDSFLRDRPRNFPLNLPNAGQCPDLPPDVVVESVCTADASGVRGRDRAVCPPGLAEHLRRVSASQELTVEAALTGRRETVFEAMLSDPLAGRIDWDQLQAMTDEMLDATAEWLPQFRVTQPIACTVHVAESLDELAREAADSAAEAIMASIALRGHANVMLATGDSQLAFLARLATVPGIDWSRVVGFHMDEYVGMGDDHPASFARYMRERVVAEVHPGEFHFLNGAAADPVAECRRYADLIAAHPLDLCCLGIGENGHLAFNDPPVADFADPDDVKVVALDDACKRQQVGEGHFPDVEHVPPTAMTVTIPALLRARVVLAIVPETRKAVAVRDALEGPVSPACPASILQQTSHAIVFLDRESSSLLTPPSEP